MSFAVLYRSDARFASAFWQIRSQFHGDRVVGLPGRTRIGGCDLLHDLDDRITSEWSVTGQQLVENDSQAEDVGSPVHPVTFASGLLGTHVSRGPCRDAATLSEVLVSKRNTEVGETGFTRSVDQDVGGLDVPVDQPSAMGVVQCVGDRGDQSR